MKTVYIIHGTENIRSTKNRDYIYHKRINKRIYKWCAR